MRKFIAQLGIFTLLLFHFGCSSVQQRTAFGGSFDIAQESQNKGENPEKTDLGEHRIQTFEEKVGGQDAVSIVAIEAFPKDKEFVKKPTFKAFKRNLLQNANKLKVDSRARKLLSPLSHYKKHFKQDFSSTDWSGYSLFLWIGLIAAVVTGICYFGLTFGFLGSWRGDSTAGCFAIMLFLLCGLISIISLVIGLVMYLYSLI